MERSPICTVGCGGCFQWNVFMFPSSAIRHAQNKDASKQVSGKSERDVEEIHALQCNIIPFQTVSGSLSDCGTVLKLSSKQKDSRPYGKVLLPYEVLLFWRSSLFFLKLFSFQSLLRVVPGVTIYFSSLRYLQSLLPVGSIPSPLQNVLMGGCARSGTTILVLPFIVLKARFEVTGSNWFHYRKNHDVSNIFH